MASPVELAGLVAEHNVDIASGTEVLSSDGHHGSPRLGASMGCQALERRLLYGGGGENKTLTQRTQAAVSKEQSPLEFDPTDTISSTVSG